MDGANSRGAWDEDRSGPENREMHTGSVGGGGGGGDDCPPHDNIFSLSGRQLRFMCLEALRRGSIYPQGIPIIANVFIFLLFLFI